jgi:hypothetical protein
MTVDIIGPVTPTTGDEHYLHQQAVPSALWTITHNLGFYPNVTVIDSANTQVEADPVYVSDSVLTIAFPGGAMAGSATLS